MPSGIAPEELEVGQRYRVTFDDCCVRGWFEGTFVELRYDTEERVRDNLDEVAFDNGVIGPNWGSWTITVAGVQDA